MRSLSVIPSPSAVRLGTGGGNRTIERFFPLTTGFRCVSSHDESDTRTDEAGVSLGETVSERHGSNPGEIINVLLV